MVSWKFSTPAPSPANLTDRKLCSGKLYWMTQKVVLEMGKDLDVKETFKS